MSGEQEAVDGGHAGPRRISSPISASLRPLTAHRSPLTMSISAYLLDCEGTLYTDDGPVPGAPEAVARLRGARIPVHYVSNTTRRARAALVERLRGFGFPAEAGHVQTAGGAGAAVLRNAGVRTVAP